MTDSRYPYTYAADYLRMIGGYDERGCKLSRSDAARIREEIAAVVGMPDEDLARKLADQYKANEDAICQGAVEGFMQARATP